MAARDSLPLVGYASPMRPEEAHATRAAKAPSGRTVPCPTRPAQRDVAHPSPRFTAPPEARGGNVVAAEHALMS